MKTDMNEISDEAIYELLQSVNVDDVKLGIIIGLRYRDEMWWKERFHWENDRHIDHKTNTYGTYYFFIYKGYMIRLGSSYISYKSSTTWTIDQLRVNYKVEIINVDEYENG